MYHILLIKIFQIYFHLNFMIIIFYVMKSDILIRIVSKAKKAKMFVNQNIVNLLMMIILNVIDVKMDILN